jgi:hypothetical protein
MLHPPSPAELSTCPAVWSALPSELQQRAVRLLTQLAFAQLRHPSLSTPEEILHDSGTQQPQDSSRPS